MAPDAPKFTLHATEGTPRRAHVAWDTGSKQGGRGEQQTQRAGPPSALATLVEGDEHIWIRNKDVQQCTQVCNNDSLQSQVAAVAQGDDGHQARAGSHVGEGETEGCVMPLPVHGKGQGAAVQVRSNTNDAAAVHVGPPLGGVPCFACAIMPSINQPHARRPSCSPRRENRYPKVQERPDKQDQVTQTEANKRAGVCGKLHANTPLCRNAGAATSKPQECPSLPTE